MAGEAVPLNERLTDTPSNRSPFIAGRASSKLVQQHEAPWRARLDD